MIDWILAGRFFPYKERNQSNIHVRDHYNVYTVPGNHIFEVWLWLEHFHYKVVESNNSSLVNTYLGATEKKLIEYTIKHNTVTVTVYIRILYVSEFDNIFKKWLLPLSCIYICN